MSQTAKTISRVPLRTGLKTALAAAALTVLAGCASVNIDDALSKTNDEAGEFTQGQLSLARTAEQREQRERSATELLAKPVGQSEAVRLALVNSPALQAMLAQNWAAATGAAQSGRIPNPVLSFERLRAGDEVELERLLSFGLLDLLTLPQRHQMAQRQVAEQQLRLTSEVIDQVTQVRQAWVNAVAAQQNVTYAKKVNEAAEASSELARRLQAAGSFSRLQRAREQVFHAEAVAQWAAAEHARTATREALVRLLGLTDAQSKALTLPGRLPSLPKSPRTPQEVSDTASKVRLDVQGAQAEFAARSKAQGLDFVTSFTDIELGLRRNTTFDNAEGESASAKGFEVSVTLPLFDWGGNQRDAMSAQTLAAANQLEATVRAAGSNLRESYSAYRTAYDISKHYRDEVVPLRQIISEENVLRYNGMLISVFELLSDARDQVASVVAAIAAEQQFWLADAALQASVIGKPTVVPMAAMASGGGGGEGGH